VLKAMTRRGRRGAVAAVAAGLAVPVALIAATMMPAPAAAAPVAGGVYVLASGSSGKCIQIAGASTANGGLFVQVACDTANAGQRFTAVAQGGAFGFTNAASGKCLDVPNSTTASGTQLWQWTCGASANQTWSLTASTAAPGKFLVTSAANGLCVSNRDGSTAGNNPIVQEACSDVARMQWRFDAVGGGPTTPPTGPVQAFPGAVGFGAQATGGRGGTVYHVTNLNDSGAGSFRDAVSQNNRIVVFDVGGYIRLTSTVLVKSNITIAGQTAPGGGTGVMGGEVSFNSASNVIVRNFRFRQGDLDPVTDNNAVNWLDASNLIFDHVSIEFGRWNNVGAVRASNITFQYSINANPIGQQFGAHTETGPFTWWRNLWANSHGRNPLAKGNTQFVNNVVYNYQAGYTAGNSSGHFLHDVVGNYFITGPRTTSASNYYYQMGNQTVYNRDNLWDSTRDGALNGVTGAVRAGATEMSSPWSPATASIPTLAAAAGYTEVMANAGALPRDAVDNLVVADIRSLGTAGNLWASQTATGLGNSGYGTLAGGSAAADTDRDGMPDAWETRYGLNPSANDAGGDFDRTGYTNVEKYVNGLMDRRYP
jgi:pectate lyase